MKIQALTTLLFLLVAANEAKIMDKCQLAKELKANGMEGYQGYKLGDWICMAYHESRFNTKAVGPRNKDKSQDFGIFQINNKFWCKDGTFPSRNGCNKSCKSFTDDNIRDDIECAKRIVRDPQKMNAWVGWVKHCKNKDLSHWTKGCKM